MVITELAVLKWMHIIAMDVEATLYCSIRIGRTLAYFYWAGIAAVAFLGVVKPF